MDRLFFSLPWHHLCSREGSGAWAPRWFLLHTAHWSRPSSSDYPLQNETRDSTSMRVTQDTSGRRSEEGIRPQSIRTTSASDLPSWLTCLILGRLRFSLWQREPHQSSFVLILFDQRPLLELRNLCLVLRADVYSSVRHDVTQSSPCDTEHWQETSRQMFANVTLILCDYHFWKLIKR